MKNNTCGRNGKRICGFVVGRAFLPDIPTRVRRMARERDLFANFERMRREMDALFGDVVDRSLTPRRGGFSPRVDVFYAPDPPRARAW